MFVVQLRYGCRDLRTSPHRAFLPAVDEQTFQSRHLRPEPGTSLSAQKIRQGYITSRAERRPFTMPRSPHAHDVLRLRQEAPTWDLFCMDSIYWLPTWRSEPRSKGFLLGWHLLTRIPCAYPGDIVLLRSVDDFFIAPTSAYEGLAVMRASDELL